MPGSHHRYWGAWESHPEAVPVLECFWKPRTDDRWDCHLQMCGLPVEGGVEGLHLSPNQWFAPAGQGESETLDSKSLGRSISQAQQNSQHLGKLVMCHSEMHCQHILYWLLF